VEIFKALKECRDSGFKDQITRSALSIPSNIAKGYERDTNKDAINNSITPKARQASYALRFILVWRLGYIQKQTGLSWIQEAQEISKMLSGLIKVRTLLP